MFKQRVSSGRSRRGYGPLIALLGALGLLLAAAWSGAAGPNADKTKIGAAVAEETFRDLQGGLHSVRSKSSLPAVYLFLSTQCPISNVYTPRMIALDRAYRTKGVRFFGVYSNAHEKSGEIANHAKERAYPFVIVKDDGSLAARLGATMTPEAVLVDQKGAVRYRGRIDDHQDPARVTSRSLQAAIDAVLAGKAIVRAEAPAFGCMIRTAAANRAVKTARVTYTRDVAPILQKNCLECHRKGEVAPFSVETYEQAAAWAQAIKTYTANRRMPPWKADSHGEFLNERRLTDKQIATLAAWADANAPKGDPKHLPKPPRFRTGWKLGEPDRIVEMPETYTLAPDGKDIYQCFVIPSGYESNRWVSKLEVQPGNRAVVHHVLVYLDLSGTARKLDAADPAPGYTNPTPGNSPGFLPAGMLGGWAPGNQPEELPYGVGNPLPKGADIVLEVHYHKNGKPENDRTRVGLHFNREPVEKALRIGTVINATFRIPPGARKHEVKASLPLGQDITVLGVTPHMHVLGRSMKVTATLPDKTEKRLVYVPDWDFNWQISYGFKQPMKLSKGSRLNLTAIYDNSSQNPFQPNNPPREVRWGEETTDEMCIAFYGYTVDSENLLKRADK